MGKKPRGGKGGGSNPPQPKSATTNNNNNSTKPGSQAAAAALTAATAPVTVTVAAPADNDNDTGNSTGVRAGAPEVGELPFTVADIHPRLASSASVSAVASPSGGRGSFVAQRIDTLAAAAEASARPRASLSNGQIRFDITTTHSAPSVGAAPALGDAFQEDD